MIKMKSCTSTLEKKERLGLLKRELLSRKFKSEKRRRKSCSRKRKLMTKANLEKATQIKMTCLAATALIVAKRTVVMGLKITPKKSKNKLTIKVMQNKMVGVKTTTYTVKIASIACSD